MKYEYYCSKKQKKVRNRKWKKITAQGIIYQQNLIKLQWSKINESYGTTLNKTYAHYSIYKYYPLYVF